MTDHDQRLKVLLREFFAAFIELFFPLWAARFDFTTLAWLDKEIFIDPPQGERRELDLVAQLTAREPVPTPRGPATGSTLALIHIEVESAEKVAAFRGRMYHYYDHLRTKYDLPVLPIALYLRVGLDGLGWDVYEEYFWEHRIIHFTYPYVGLPALDAEKYVRQDNWLGVALAALMKVSREQRLALGQEAWRRLLRCPENAYRRYLLCECVDAYLPQNDEERRAYETTLLSDPDPEVRTMSMTTFERLRHEGRLQGKREVLLIHLESRFGPVSPEVRQRLEALSVDQLDDLARAVLKAQSLQDLGLKDS
jgi:hypothetical protein